LGGTLVVEAHRPLIPLLSRMDCIDQVIAFDSLTAPQIAYDLHIPMMSLPLLFQTRKETIPNQVPYVFADAGNTGRWRSRICLGDLRVGIVWAGSTTDPQRACSLEQILTWFSAQRVHFYSLQKDITEHQTRAMSEVENLTLLGDHLNDFNDTASVIANLDLVISVDTAVAHLTGAMGKPVWILLPATPDWRWQLIGNTSAWYPTARLFRQKKKADWQPVIESIRQALIRLASSPVDLRNNDHAPGHTPALDSMEFRIFKSGRKYFDCGNFEKAANAFQTVISQTPQFDKAYFMLGRAFHELGRWEKAIWAYSEAVRLNRDFAEAYRNLGLAFHQIGNLANSAHNYEQALRLQPQQAAVLSNLGVVYNQLNKPDAAADCFRKALSIDPTYVDASYNLGNLYLKQANLDKAIACYTRTLALNPLHLQALGNIGRAHHRKGQLDQAMRFYEKALSIHPEDPTTRLNRAVTLLLKGDWETGWPEYEWRFKQHDWHRTYPHRLTGPRWHGETFHNKTLLAHCEQGIGDALQFVRFLPKVKSRGGRIVFQVRRSLMSLFKTIQCVDEFIELSAEKPPEVQYDLHTPICSLAGIFKIRPSCIPNCVPYLFADRKKIVAWSKRIEKKGMHVGLVWAGSDTYPERACNFKDFAPLGRLTGINWMGLQKGPAASQADENGVRREMAITNWGTEFRDFSDTAAAIVNLDLVISIDTSVAHLAGALGKPIWLLLPKVADWRWLRNSDRSPWYPTMRLFRQSQHGSWDTVIKAIFQKLQSMTPAKLRQQNDEDKKTCIGP
jgi:tetratricopeptide (TPR) repeat protein